MTAPESSIADLMDILTEYARGKRVIEIGCAHGNGSTRAFARAEPKQHIIVDWDEQCLLEAEREAPRAELIKGDSGYFTTARVASMVLLAAPDIIFIDTEHTYDQISNELFVWSWLAYSKTIWLFHDTWMWGKYNHMTDAIKEFAAANGWRYEDVTKESHGLGKMWKD